jgi:hypothetical protein
MLNQWKKHSLIVALMVICGDDMCVREGSESFVDVSGLAGLSGHKVTQLRIVTAQALVSTH